MPKYSDEPEAIAECAAFGLHPKIDPLGEDHHTDAKFSAEDKKIGSALAWFLGSMHVDCGGSEKELGEYFYRKSTPIDEWSRVVRALRIHGLKIADAS